MTGAGNADMLQGQIPAAVPARLGRTRGRQRTPQRGERPLEKGRMEQSCAQRARGHRTSEEDPRDEVLHHLPSANPLAQHLFYHLCNVRCHMWVPNQLCSHRAASEGAFSAPVGLRRAAAASRAREERDDSGTLLSHPATATPPQPAEQSTLRSRCAAGCSRRPREQK